MTWPWRARPCRAVDLDGFADRSVTGLSGGEARRLAFASLLVQDPEIMLLDEPTNHLDLRHQVQIMGMIRSGPQEGPRSALAALHDINLAARYCSHVVMLFGDGEWCAGPADDMLSEVQPGAAVTAVRLNDLESASGPRFHPLPADLDDHGRLPTPARACRAYIPPRRQAPRAHKPITGR